MTDRAMLLLKMARLQDLATPHSREYTRWQNIKRGSARMTTHEVEELGKIFPNYRWWIMTGEVMPEVGQTSPDYDEANRNLPGHHVG